MRIVKPRDRSRAAIVSLGLAGAAAVLVPVVWRLWGSEEVGAARQRTLAVAELEWRCEKGHDLRGSGHVFGEDGLTAPRTCWKCGEPAYPSARYVCAVHGAFDTTVRFRLGEDGHSSVAFVRVAGREWVLEEEVRCPRCGRPLRYSNDPLTTTDRGPGRGGG